ncbi:MAG: transcriptional repressor, partial [Nitrospinaceae bacterium]|nr:transcriptional repressor [Nitrospinaceae bacterium]NIR55410.1 transcriptional repressor [Nitrospinaceae bacterium]NIS85850.1 transcriptional repressor [Nitrospinaceae bacterium]NIT82694.1 transcriptional repressor [Nitrospinaceae bacterium]NIU45903.1 transcriptional repressor [Nitrospinaceae bacterium]
MKIFEDFLKDKDMRLTHPRKIILQVFLQSTRHMEIEELHEQVRKADKDIGLSTVYRTMKLLIECGLAQENVFFKDKKCFERVHDRDHHDHLVCTRCKKVQEFHHPMIERFQEKTAEKHQFSIIYHRMTLFGIC